MSASRETGLDILFVHVGRAHSRGRDLLIMPLGLAALADLLERGGVRARVYNAAAAEAAGGAEPLGRVLARLAPRVVGLDLHWHQQTRGVLEAAREVRRALPGAFVVAGGFTASLYDRGLLDAAPEIDAVVRGDAEGPLPDLVRRVLGGERDLSGVANLAWRRGGGIARNAQTYAACDRDLEDLRYGRLELVLNRDDCLRGLWRDEQAGSPEYRDRRVVFYNPGRGCPHDCSFCGGGRRGQAAINGRPRLARKSPDSALRDLSDFASAGARTVHVCFDPFPDDGWYAELFRRVRAARLELAMVFECWGLPSPAFVAAFAETFGPGSRLILSPESGSERVRRLNKSRPYTNAELAAALETIRARGVAAEVCFGVGLPGETAEDVRATERLAAALSRRFACAVAASPIAAEPASPVFLDPAARGVALRRRTLADFAAQDGPYDVGYRTEALPEDEIARRALRLERLCVRLNERRGR
ncbi:MAG: radical SAM protein [Elusimicrobia bacterium]|nr:radical SAM protein [Elusimicrobiota bacterium]